MQYVQWHRKNKKLAQEVKCYDNKRVEMAIDRFINHRRNRLILKRRLIDGICYEPLAEEFELSVRQVKNIVYKNENLIFDAIEKGLV